MTQSIKTTTYHNFNQCPLIAHRLGYAMTSYPENSLESLKQIFEDSTLLDSCDGFEFDICFTKDSIPVVIHDKHIDDVSDGIGLVKDFTLEELRQITFGFRKSLNKSENCSFRIVSLEEMLHFFEDNHHLLGTKAIKIETKEACCFSTKNLEVLADILNKFPGLSPNIVHLSFWPQNLKFLRDIQKRKGFIESKTDLLCDYNAMVNIARYLNFLNAISLRVKTKIRTEKGEYNSSKTNQQIAFEKMCMYISDAANQTNIEYAIDFFGTVGLYTINTLEDLEALSEIIEKEFLKQNSSKITITTNNPYYLRTLTNRNIQ